MNRDAKVLAVGAVVIVALLLVSSLLPREYRVEPFELLDETVIEWENGTPVERPRSELPDAGGPDEEPVCPEEIVPGLVEIKEPDDLTRLEKLAKLEGQQKFKNVLPTSYYHGGWDCLPVPCADYALDGDRGVALDEVKATYNEVLGPSTAALPERDIEEADLVKLVGDRLYILNPYRGLIIVDISQPASPGILGRAHVVGTPVEMYIVGDMAYIITSTNFQYWYEYGVISLSSNVDTGGSEQPTYRIGSQVMVVDMSDPSSPERAGRVYLEGLITDSRRVGDVIYFVSSCHEWYASYGVNGSVDESFVLSLNLADPTRISCVDRVSFPGGSNVIHVTTDTIYVAHPYNKYSYGGYTDITLVDISDPNGDILVRDSFHLNGTVEDRFQMDHYEGTFRVVSHFPPWGRGSSDLWVFDVSNPDEVAQLGRLRIDDAGDLMATRFAGERAYTIHLPRSIDPLDVLDLSDPTDPKLCDVLEMPGWVTHMEVRGMNIIALGVDGSGNVAVSLFDVTDPWDAVLVERVSIGEGRSWSEANMDPKALTVLDEQGLVVVPFSSDYDYRDGNGNRQYTHVDGVQLVEFDLDENHLRLAGWFTQEDAVTRTRGVGDHVLATSPRFLQVADVSDPDAPEVKATVELCPNVLDVREYDGFVAQIHRSSLDGRLILRTSSHPSIDLGTFLAEMPLDIRVRGYYWNGHYLHLLRTRTDKNGASWATLVSIDLTDPYLPYESGGCTFSIPSEDIPSLNSEGNYYSNGSSVLMFDMCFSPYPTSYGSYEFENPILVDEGLLVLFVEGRLYSIDLSSPGRPTVASVVAVSCDPVEDIRAAGRMVYLTDREETRQLLDRSGRTYYKFYLHRVDLTDPSRPLRLPDVNIPGVPLGTDATGEYLYTKASWWLGDDDGYATTINVVRLGLGVATLESAFEPGSYSDLVIEGDKAIIVRTSSYYGRYYYGYQDSMQGDTTVEVIDLLSKGGPAPTATLTIETRCYGLRVAGGYIFMNPDGDDGLMVYRLEGDGSLATVGFYTVRPEYSSIHVEDGRAYVMQGMYGLSVLDLDRD